MKRPSDPPDAVEEEEATEEATEEAEKEAEVELPDGFRRTTPLADAGFQARLRDRLAAAAEGAPETVREGLRFLRTWDSGLASRHRGGAARAEAPSARAGDAADVAGRRRLTPRGDARAGGGVRVAGEVLRQVNAHLGEQ